MTEIIRRHSNSSMEDKNMTKSNQYHSNHPNNLKDTVKRPQTAPTKRIENVDKALKLMRLGIPLSENNPFNRPSSANETAPYSTTGLLRGEHKPIILHNMDEIIQAATMSSLFERRRLKQQDPTEKARKKRYGYLTPIDPVLLEDILKTESPRAKLEPEKPIIKQKKSREATPCWNDSVNTSPVENDFFDPNRDVIRTQRSSKLVRGGTSRTILISSSGSQESLASSGPRSRGISRGPSASNLLQNKTDRLSIMKKKEELIEKELQRKLNDINEKKRAAEHRLKLQEQKQLQHSWSSFVFIASRIGFLTNMIANLRAIKKYESHQVKQKRAVLKIEKWWRYAKLDLLMRQHAIHMKRIRRVVLVFKRKINVKKRRQACVLIKQFIADVGGVSERTQKLYRYRNRVIRVQRWARSFLQCLFARVKLLQLALQKSIFKMRVKKHKEQHQSENNSIKSMKRNKFFGDTVQKLDYLCENVTTILASRVPSRINKQSLNSSGTLQLGQSGKFNLKSPHGGQPSIHGQAFLQLSKYPYYHALRVILRKTRKSFILSHYNIRSEAYSDSRIVADAVDEKEVKRFLTNPHYNNFTYTEDSLSTIYARSYFFNMLTGGALRELETLAFNIVNNEKKHYNFIVQPKSSKNNANNKHALNSSGSDIVVGYDDDMFEGSEAFF